MAEPIVTNIESGIVTEISAMHGKIMEITLQLPGYYTLGEVRQETQAEHGIDDENRTTIVICGSPPPQPRDEDPDDLLTAGRPGYRPLRADEL